MAKKSEYMKELERQYQEKHALKLKLKNELKALKKRKTLPKKKDFKFPELKHPKNKTKKVSDVPKPKRKSIFGNLFKKKRKVRKPKKKSWLKKLFKKRRKVKPKVVKKVRKSRKKSIFGSLFKKKKEVKPKVVKKVKKIPEAPKSKEKSWLKNLFKKKRKVRKPKKKSIFKKWFKKRRKVETASPVKTMPEPNYGDMLFGGGDFLVNKKKKKPQIDLGEVPSPKKKKSWSGSLFKKKRKVRKPKKKSWLKNLFKKRRKVKPKVIPVKKVKKLPEAPKPKKSWLGSLFKKKVKKKEPKTKKSKDLFDGLFDDVMKNKGSKVEKSKKAEKTKSKKSWFGSLFKKKKDVKPKVMPVKKVKKVSDVPKPKKKSWFGKLLKKKIFNKKIDKVKPKKFLKPAKVEKKKVVKPKKSWFSGLFDKKPVTKPKVKPVKKVKKVSDVPKPKKKSWFSKLLNKKIFNKKIDKVKPKKFLKSVKAEKPKKSLFSALFDKKEKPKEVFKPKEEKKESFFGQLFEKKEAVKDDVKTKKVPRHIDVPKDVKIRKSLVDKFLVKEKKPVKEEKSLLQGLLDAMPLRKPVKPPVNEKKFVASLKKKLDKDDVEDKLDYLANNPDPRVRAYNLINACWKSVKRKKLSKAEFYYEQIKPLYEKLTIHEKEHMFSDLVQLQNALVMLRIKITKDKLRRR